MTNLIEKDLVVLKRNDRKDANVSEENGLYDLYLTESKELYFYRSDKNKWTLSNLNGDYDYYKSLKPIEKPMKEYLLKTEDGTYHYHNDSYDVCPKYVERIEIPEGAEEYKANGKFYKENSSLFCLSTMEWTRSKLKKNAYPALWHRHTHHEELPLMDDEPSLNDQYAEIETARQSEKVLKEILEGDLPDFDFKEIDAFIESNVEQGQKHSHYKKDVSHLNVIDIYRVTEMFKPHSCGAHIAKKALCSGQRGHKDLLTGIQDIIDTAERWKEMLIEDEKTK